MKVTELASKTPLCTTCPIEGLNEPGGLSFDGEQTIYIADTNNHCIKKMDIETYTIETIDLKMPKSAENTEEVDFSKASLYVKVNRG